MNGPRFWKYFRKHPAEIPLFLLDMSGRGWEYVTGFLDACWDAVAGFVHWVVVRFIWRGIIGRVWRYVTGGLESCWDAAAAGIHYVVARFIRRGMVGMVWRYVTGSLEFCGYVVVRFVERWFASRPVAALWWGMPAVFVGTAVLFLVLVADYHSRHGAVISYLDAVARESRVENWKLVDFYLQKLVVLDQANLGTRFSLAIAAERRGHADRARQLMKSIAPAGASGYAPAHFWLAADLAKHHSPFDDSEQLLFEHHLKQTVLALPDHADAHRMLGELYARQRRFEKAIPHLQRAVRGHPAALLTLVQVYTVLGRQAQASGAAKQASARFQALIEAEPDNAEYRRLWAQVQLLLANHERAASILLDGLARRNAENPDEHPAIQELCQLLSAVYVSWFDAVSRSHADDLGRRMELLEQALHYGPNNMEALNRLALFAVEYDEPTGQAMQSLKQVLATGNAPATVHLIVGTAAVFRGEEEQGLRHLELAFEKLPEMPAVANNLAWALAHAEQPDLARAERLVDAAIKVEPENAEIRETRGIILAKLGKTKQAITDLESALSVFPKRQRIHQELAQLYEQIGDVELASLHQQLAAEEQKPPVK